MMMPSQVICEQIQRLYKPNFPSISHCMEKLGSLYITINENEAIISIPPMEEIKKAIW